MVTSVSTAFVRRFVAFSGSVVFACLAIPVHATGYPVSGNEQPPVVTGSPITVGSLISLIDFGRGDNGSDQGAAFGVSSDGRKIALVARRADPVHNRFCQTLVVLRRSGHIRPELIRLDVQPVHQDYDLRGLLTPNGQISPNPPRWSPDGKTIAILAPDHGTTQVLGISLQGGRTWFLTRAPGGVLDFAWARDGRSLVYTARAGLASFRAAADREALAGYHYDERVVPLMSPRPQPPVSLPISYRTISRATGRDREADATERTLLDPELAPGRPRDTIDTAVGPGQKRAWIAPADPGNWLSAFKLWASVDGHTISCEDAACSGRLSNVWIVGGAFLFLRREGWGNSVTAIYRWRPGASPVRLFATEDLLVGCDAAGTTLLCGRESSLQPRRLWAYEPATGRQSIIFDPNPGFDHHVLPRVERLHWTDALNSEGYGDLVIPSISAPKTGYPAIIVQYRTRGFLRGAIGDEYPVLAFAAHGFAVLSVENAPEYASLAHDPSIRTITQAIHLDTANDNERRSQLRNLMNGVATAQSRAPLDMAHIGITGVSDAASSALYALNNTRLFATASLGSPGFDPSVFAIGGPALRKAFVSFGFPMSGPAAQAFYQSIALAPNPNTMVTPLLLQYPQDEYLAGLTAITALQDAKAPIDTYIFPGEPHLKWQPAHWLALYRRNLAWFDFWLRGREDAPEADPAELARWRVLRGRLCDRKAPQSDSIQVCK